MTKKNESAFKALPVSAEDLAEDNKRVGGAQGAGNNTIERLMALMVGYEIHPAHAVSSGLGSAFDEKDTTEDRLAAPILPIVTVEFLDDKAEPYDPPRLVCLRVPEDTDPAIKQFQCCGFHREIASQIKEAADRSLQDSIDPVRIEEARVVNRRVNGVS